MPASRVRVRPPHSHAGLLVTTAVFGAMMGIPGGVWSVMIFSSAVFEWFNHSMALYNAIMMVIIFVPFVLFLLWLPRQCQHGRWAAGAGASYALMVVLVGALGEYLHRPTGGLVNPVDFALNAATMIAIGAGLALLSSFVHRTFFFRHIEQDGTLCTHCAYPARRSGSERCPECGRVSTDVHPTRSERMIAFVSGRARIVVAIVIGMLVTGYVVAWSHGQVHRTFGTSYSDEWNRAEYGSPVPREQRLSSAVYRSVPGEENMLVVVDLVHTAVWERRRMYVRLGFTADGRVVQPGEQLVFIEVPRGEMKRLMRREPSEELMGRLIEAGRAAEWKPGGWPFGGAVEVPWGAEE